MTPIEEILKKNNLSITGSRQKIMQLFMDSNGALAHADIEKKTGESFDPCYGLPHPTIVC